MDVINRGFSGYNTKLAKCIVSDVFRDDKIIFGSIFFGANDAAIESSLQHGIIQYA